MSLRHALLGLLAVTPATGYQLTQEFAGALGRYAWQAGHTRIYPELVKLNEEGLVQVIAEGARGSRTYAVTEAGRRELRDWLMAPPDRGVVRNEQVLRMFLISALPQRDTRALLSGIAARCAEKAGELRATLAGAAREGPLEFGLLAAEYGRRQYEATGGWAQWALGELDRRGSLVDPNPADRAEPPEPDRRGDRLASRPS
jgi:DNA-binding PadR family transcriptional regulator